MKKLHEAKKVGDFVEPKHEVEQLCSACGYDLNEAELEAERCSDCGAALVVQQNTKIFVTTLPSAEGITEI